MDHQTTSAGYNTSPLLDHSSLNLHSHQQLFTSLPHPSDQPTASGSSSGPASKKRKTTKGARNGSTDVNAEGEAGNMNGNGEGEKGNGETRKRPQSCDVCRARKVKCVKPAGAVRCEGCVSLDQICKYTHERKKPGPANRSVQRHSRRISRISLHELIMIASLGNPHLPGSIPRRIPLLPLNYLLYPKTHSPCLNNPIISANSHRKAPSVPQTSTCRHLAGRHLKLPSTSPTSSPLPRRLLLKTHSRSPRRQPK